MKRRVGVVDDSDDSLDEPPRVKKGKGKEVEKAPALRKKSKKEKLVEKSKATEPEKPVEKSKATAPAKSQGKRLEPVSNGIPRDPRCKMCEEKDYECWERTGTGHSCLNCCKWKMKCELQSDNDSSTPSEDEELVPKKLSGKKRSAPVPDDEPALKKAKMSGANPAPKKKEGKKSKPPAPTQSWKPPAPTQPSKPPAPTQSKNRKVIKSAANVPTSDGEAPIPGPSKPQPPAPMRQELPGPEWLKQTLINYFGQSFSFIFLL